MLAFTAIALPDQMDAKGKPSAVHKAAAAGDIGSLTKQLKKKPTLVAALDGDGLTPLHVAAKNGRAEAVGFLIAHGADVNAGAAKTNATPLLFVALTDCTATADTLLAHGADPNALTESGGGPLHAAAGVGNAGMVALLLARGAELNLQDRNEGWSALIHAIFYKRDTIVALLLDRGAELGLRAHRGYAALHVAAETQNENAAKLLIQRGADVNVADARKRTPLHEAARNGNLAIVKLLLSKGADVNAKDEFDASPLTEAQQSGHTEIVEIFVRGQGSKH